VTLNINEAPADEASTRPEQAHEKLDMQSSTQSVLGRTLAPFSIQAVMFGYHFAI
jgi:hypothetical protein